MSENIILIYSLGIAFISVLIAAISITILELLGREGLDIKYLLSLAAGIFIGIIFLDIFPEILEEGSGEHSIYIFMGFIFLSIIELIFGYHEKHHINVKSLGYLDLISDLIHNFIDGLFIIYSLSIDLTLGILVGLGTIVHELPQEISDYVILIYSGFSRGKAILFNVLVSLSTVIAVLIGFIYPLDPLNLLSFMAGTYIYLATVDLIPEVSRSTFGRRRVLNYILFLLGISIVYLAITVIHI